MKKVTNTQVFPLDELAKVVAPNDLNDVLKTLKENGYITSFLISNGLVRLSIPLEVEIGQMFKGLENTMDEDDILKELAGVEDTDEN